MANTAPNYPTNLQELFSGPNPFLAQMGLQQFNTAQNQAGENLQSAMQDRTQSADMHPLKMAQQQAETGNTLASARLSNSTAAQHEDALKVLQGVPMDQRISAKLAETLKGRSDSEKAMLQNEMSAAAVYAAKGAMNGGKLPLPELMKAQQAHPGLVQYLSSPDGIKKLAQVVNSYNALGAERQQAESTARIHAAATTGAANINANAMIKGKQMEIDAGKYKKNEMSYMLNKALYGGKFEEAITAATALAMDAKKTGDQEAFDHYAGMAQDLNEKLLAKQRAAAETANIGKPDLNALKDGKLQGIQPRGAPTPAPVSNPKPQNALPPGWDYKGTK
jgi:hypothetical protein